MSGAVDAALEEGLGQRAISQPGSPSWPLVSSLICDSCAPRRASADRFRMSWSRSEDDDAGFLTILLDVTASLWRAPSTDLPAKQLLEQLLAFINAYILLNSSNRLAVFAAGASGSYLIYQYSDASQQQPGSAETQLVQKLEQVLAREAEAPSHHASGLSSGLSRALCYINSTVKAMAERAPAKPRLLCIMGCPDDSRQYIAVMNAIFSAQRSEVSIDCCKLGEGHSTFLQQAAYITNGVYIRPSKPAALLEYLLTAYACDPFSRQFLRLPKPTSVDFRASCFCHKRSIDIGFICSVCLSIFCEKVPACITCGEDFEAAAAAKPS